MILVTCKETGLPAYIWCKEITSIESHGGSSPFTRIWCRNDKLNHEYFLDVKESNTEISRRIKEERLTPGSLADGE